ncbi:MAG: STAS domain-containing protein [Caulobacteraceae bacterium]
MVQTAPRSSDLQVTIVPGSLDGGDKTIARISGELDAMNAAALRDALDVAHEPGRRVVVDLEDVTFIDSSGICVLVECANRALAEGRRELFSVRADDKLRRTFEVLGLTDHLGIVGKPG